MYETITEKEKLFKRCLPVLSYLQWLRQKLLQLFIDVIKGKFSDLVVLSSHILFLSFCLDAENKTKIFLHDCRLNPSLY